jgi:hypothetical protein
VLRFLDPHFNSETELSAFFKSGAFAHDLGMILSRHFRSNLCEKVGSNF